MVKTGRINDVTKGLTPSYSNRLNELSPKQSSVICDYISALRSEIKLSNGYRRNIVNTLIALSRISKRKEFKDFTRADVITFMNQFRKEDSEDATHKWIGTYNSNLIHIIKFFKWLYFPDVEPAKRSKPEVVLNLPKLKRHEISGYQPNDMWIDEDNLIFLKYCPNSKDRCYHAMEVDTGARPHELLGLRVKDVEFVEGEGNCRYATIIVNGKTGQRPLPLIDSIPFVTQWLSEHPQRDNREAFLLLNSQNPDKAVQVGTMHKAYIRYKKYFTKLLSTDIPEDNKKRIKTLVKKRWNPYVHRHSAITEKSKMLSSDSKLRQYAGWSVTSNMNRRYLHLTGGEATNDLLRLKGVIKDKKQPINILQPKTCPSCRELNKPDAHFCAKCNFIMSFEAYQKGMEERKKKDQEILELKEQMVQSKQEIKDQFQAYEAKMNEFVHDVQSRLISEEEQSNRVFVMDKMREILDRTAPGWFDEVFGPGASAHRLTPKGQEKIQQLLKEVTPLIDAENRQRDLELEERRKVLVNTLNDSRAS
jgi:integrase/recombinase XerD